MQDFPHQAAEAVRDRPDRLGVSQSDYEPVIHQLKDTPFFLDGSVRGLIEQTTHLPIAIRRSMAVIHTGALIVTRTDADP